MKKVLLMVWFVILPFQIFTLDDLFGISTEKIIINSYSEDEFENSDYYSSDNQFSQGIEIISITDNIKTVFNGTDYYGKELKFNNLETGNYYLEISKDGYETIKKWITLVSDKRIIIKVELAREYGHLDIKTNTENFSVLVNGYVLDDYYTLPTGKYRVKIRSFGYLDKDIKVTVSKNEVTHLNLLLEEAEFNFTDLKIDKNRFNPESKGGFSQNRFRIIVNGPGKGTLVINNSDGTAVITRKIEFTEWTTIISLSQMISENNGLPNDSYKAIISAEGKKITTDFIIDNSITYRLLPIHRGSTGLLKTATAEINNLISQTSFGLGSSVNESDISIVINHYTVILPFLQIHGGIDLDINFDSEISYFTLNGGSQLALDNNYLDWSINLNYFFNRSYSQKASDLLYHTISVNSPLTFNIEQLFFTLSPSYSYSTESSSYGLGSGIHWDNQQVRSGISLRSDTEDFNNFSLEYGGEIYYLIPNTQSYVGLNITGDKNNNFEISLIFSVLY